MRRGVVGSAQRVGLANGGRDAPASMSPRSSTRPPGRGVPIDVLLCWRAVAHSSAVGCRNAGHVKKRKEHLQCHTHHPIESGARSDGVHSERLARFKMADCRAVLDCPAASCSAVTGPNRDAHAPSGPGGQRVLCRASVRHDRATGPGAPPDGNAGKRTGTGHHHGPASGVGSRTGVSDDYGAQLLQR